MVAAEASQQRFSVKDGFSERPLLCCLSISAFKICLRLLCNVESCPRQLDSVGCGYYMQKYIHEIVHSSSTSITSLV
uniref:Uncharacterized protein n=1 Tax=Cucumis melo TaxID=3656 RepID=A0A9I9EG25_CUCME